MKYIKGNYKRTIFKSDSYVVGLFKIQETDDEQMQDYIGKSVTFTGYFSDLNEEDLYIFYGDVKEHSRYGLQFNVSNYERIKPQDKDGLVEYLSSDLFKGIGKSLAKNIVDTLGDNALNIILEDENNLLLVPKMTLKKAKLIYNTLKQYEESHEITVYLNNLGFNIKDSLNIYNTYRGNTIVRLENNPYCLVEDLKISFPKVDEIAFKFNIMPNDDKRIKACIIYIMNYLLFSSSDTYLYEDEIYNGVLNYLKLDILLDDFKRYLEDLVLENKMYILEDKYYIKEMYNAECNIANQISYMINKKVAPNNKIKDFITLLENEDNIIYNEKQKEAIIKSLENNITIITGGPGTGKTTIIKAICETYKRLYNCSDLELINQIALLAPTGRASKRLSEATLLPASTIHKFLKWNKEMNEFMINEFNKDNHKLIIVDEFSMVDLLLFDSLIKGISKSVKLILIGDYNQLPSVAPGNVLKDLIEAEYIDTIYLDHLYRQTEDSYIVNLADEIKNNNLSNFLQPKSDYTFLKCNSERILDNLKKICYQLISKNYDYKRVQIMAPIYATNNGIDNINKCLQEIFNPKDDSKNEIKYGDVIYRENDKVLQLVNLPEENISNGDIGIIKNILKINNKTYIYIDFDGNIVKYEVKDLNKIKHGYIISIHKSQGSEFELVIILVCNSYKRMLYRKLIYTGVTRAKKKLIIIGEDSSFVYAVNNNLEKTRKTNLINQIKYNISK